MPFAKLTSSAFFGIEALPIEIEVDLQPSDKLTIIIVGLPDTAVRESKDRVLSALKNSSYPFSCLHCVVNLAPGDVKKEGALYDLPIALGLLRAQGILANTLIEDYLVIGELALSGEVRPVQGILVTALLAKRLGKKGIIIPKANNHEATLVKDIEIVPVSHLKEAVEFLKTGQKSIQPPTANFPLEIQQNSGIDFSQIKGQALAKRALEIAAAGGHNVLLSGPPGSGKTMLAKALITIMPELSLEEALEVTKIHSIAGLLPEGSHFISQRPFRAPHHSISYAGLIGGGNIPRPGEVTLAHHGILFLDEFPEFSRHTLEVLRQPLEDRQVTISRAQGHFTFPSCFVFIAAMNPCPCGYLGHSEKACKDTERQVHQYRSKISGPLLDRIDMHVDVPQTKYKELFLKEEAESSQMIRSRVKQARIKQKERFSNSKTNAQMNPADLKHFVKLSSAAESLMQHAMEEMHLSARVYHRLLKVALTISDLLDEQLNENHLLEALQFRSYTPANQ